jgi:hypothetical protein
VIGGKARDDPELEGIGAFGVAEALVDCSDGFLVVKIEAALYEIHKVDQQGVVALPECLRASGF